MGYRINAKCLHCLLRKLIYHNINCVYINITQYSFCEIYFPFRRKHNSNEIDRVFIIVLA